MSGGRGESPLSICINSWPLPVKLAMHFQFLCRFFGAYHSIYDLAEVWFTMLAGILPKAWMLAGSLLAALPSGLRALMLEQGDVRAECIRSALFVLILACESKLCLHAHGSLCNEACWLGAVGPALSAQLAEKLSLAVITSR